MMPQKVQRVKGVNDILPLEAKQWQALEHIVKRVMDRYAFGEIRPPIFEKTELFARGVGEDTDIVSKEMYSFSDMSKSSLTLRPELTAGVVRCYIQNNLQQISPVQKLWYEGPMFRQERPQKGRYRQFWQFGAEAIGSPNPEQDAEMIALFYAILKELGIEKSVTLKINSVGDGESRALYHSALQEYLRPHLSSLSETSQKRFESNPLRILDSKAPNDKELVRDAPKIRECLNDASATHYAEVLRMLEAMDIPYVQDDLLVRGLDYYTHTIFEFTSDALGAQDAICGGGRYNDLVKELGGQDVPAIGWASGIERLLLVVDALQPLKADSGLDLFLIVQGEDLRVKASKLIHEWRSAGLNCDLDTLRRSMKAQMREANRQEARFVAILGEDEFGQGIVQLKNFETGEQEAVAFHDVVSTINKALLS
ncbi:MAG: histidine--tRNA ligase [Candidatus Marinimicrobia bacterium]|nr:histidine--tRNA ligase [Candidatus Neomarinimicrobiota bacterium]MBT3576870.1 histidine--tRNA ligase [Candidatus Neomarinimicrobiota bacterium]MBT3680229.1 histidine--tRNA ligase [Candidatus Neomarinimicrobiota bacterium]MBT3951911.1 histidine--tRNA ligase [Candidatus Neomarinimicrobiota bacterium]MBT4251792.1 histidine--tRNA ligase [Candidatus Neomarinimicrobiota bacterium]